MIMPYKGQVLTDRNTGNIFEFIETASDTNGERVVVKQTLKSKVKIAPDHIHTKQDETFKVISGQLTYFLNGEEKTLQAGEEILLPKNVAHNHYNTHDEPLVMLQIFEPAYDIDYFIENLIGLSDDGRVKDGNLEFLQAMVTLKYLDTPSYLAGLPISVQKFLATILTPIARMLGYRALYKKYTGIEK